jgi:hypothetical protein
VIGVETLSNIEWLYIHLILSPQSLKNVETPALTVYTWLAKEVPSGQLGLCVWYNVINITNTLSLLSLQVEIGSQSSLANTSTNTEVRWRKISGLLVFGRGYVMNI